jgi:hypothetical protein
METASPCYLAQLAADSCHPVADHPPVGLDLGFARPAEEAEAAALAFEVGPASNQPARLIIEVSQLDLEAPLRSRCPLAEYLEDEPGSIDDLAGSQFLQRFLLHGRQCRVHNQQARIIFLSQLGDFICLTLPEKTGRADLPEAIGSPFHDVDTDGGGKAGCLLDPGVQ